MQKSLDEDVKCHDGMQREARTKTLSESDASHVKLESRQTSITSVKKDSEAWNIEDTKETKETGIPRRRASGTSVEVTENERKNSIQDKDTIDGMTETPTLVPESSKGVDTLESPQDDEKGDYSLTIFHFH